MARLNWKQSFKALVSTVLLLTAEQIVVACGPSPDPEDYFPSFFDNQLVRSGSFEPFRYSAYTGLLYETWYSQDSVYALDTTDGNRAEWASYTGVPLAAVDSFVYTYPRSALASLYAEVEKGTSSGLEAAYEQNPMTQWFRNSRDLEALGYLMYAKQVQPIANAAAADPWNPPPPPDKATVQRLSSNGRQLYRAAQKPFFRDRYAYQLQRLAFTGGLYREVLNLYDSLAPKDASNMASRMLGLQAGAYYKLKQLPEAAYRYSLLFDRGDEWKRNAFISYDWSKGPDNAAAVLKRCKTSHERAVVHVLNGLMAYDQAQTDIEQALAEDPTVAGLDALVTREINKIEERYLSVQWTGSRTAFNSYAYYLNGYWGPNAQGRQLDSMRVAYKAYSEVLAGLIDRIGASSGNKQNAFWPLAGAYLAFVNQNNAACEAKLKVAESLPLTDRMRDQLSVIKLLAVSRQSDRITSETEAAMLPYLQWLDQRRSVSQRLDKTYRDFTNAYLTAYYLKQKDTVKAIYALARSQRTWGDTGMVYSVAEDFMDESGLLLQQIGTDQFEALKTFSASTSVRPFDQWLRSGNPYSLPVVYELEGTRQLRDHRFAAALEAFRKSSPQVLARHPFPDPFTVDIDDPIEATAADSGRMITKKTFAEAMVALEGKTDAESLLKQGLGLYALTYYSKAHRAWDYYRSGVDAYAYYADTARRLLSVVQTQYYNPTEAEQKFVQAAAAATNPETKAQALFMAAKCWQKRAPMPKEEYYRYNMNEKTYYRYSLKNPYFSRLKTESSGTPFYEHAVLGCDYLRDYAKRR
ncbi:MAG: hypothetical protein EOP52_04125 [Sphingobacteriales bacterium]|nr:MAG: hypothetical protein EOP52_04125 [Sphingobacteriales bacterium]